MARIGGNTVSELNQAEHIGPEHTGDNIDAKRVANYIWDGSNWQRYTGRSADNTASDTITTQNLNPSSGTATPGSAVEIALGTGQNTIAFQTVGTYTGALSLQGTVDGSNWVTLGGNAIFNVNTGLWLSTVTSGLQGIFLSKVSGFNRVRITALAAVTGSVTVTIAASAGDSFQGALGVLTTVTTVSAVTNITNWGNVVDNAAFTDGTTRLSMGGYILDETAGTPLTENDAAAARIDSKRAQVFTLEDATVRGQRAAVTAANALKVDGSGVTQPISGSVTIASTTMPTTLVAFVTNIPTAGTRVQLASNTIVNGFIIQAPSTNTGVVYVGGANVSSTVYGAELQPGQSTSVMIDNTNKIYVDTNVSGSAVAVLGT
jgi:hypothetical protein